ncbi:HEPN domain-containing protein, partial [Paracraurococcus lichenis]
MVKPGGPAEHLGKAAEFLASVAVLLRAGLAARAASDAYYAAFHAAQALLATAGLAAETHAGVHTLLARHFVKDGPLPASLSRDLTHLMADRLLADYGVEQEMTAATAREAVATGMRIVGAL